MKFVKKDWMFLVLVVIVLAVFYSISGTEKTKHVPADAMHKVVYDAAYKNAPGPDASIFKRAFFKPDKKGAEVFCDPCHREKGVSYPPNHPPKNRCLFCHKLKKD